MKSRVLNKAIKNSIRINFNNRSKIVFFSDCHRGDGTYKDSLFPNVNIYLTALRYYLRNEYTYIELGDGDELWKFKRLEDIYEANDEIYKVLAKFKKSKKLYMIYGNHDKKKSKKNFVPKILKTTSRDHKLYKFYFDLPIYEGIILTHEESGRDFLGIHGHQVDFFNNQACEISKFLVRYIWSILEGVMGFKDIISPAKSNNKRRILDNKILKLAEENNKRIIIGHTHRTIFPENCETPYFNCGCCVLPNTVTAIEIENGTIALVKWTIKALNSGHLVVLRDIIGGPQLIECY